MVIVGCSGLLMLHCNPLHKTPLCLGGWSHYNALVPAYFFQTLSGSHQSGTMQGFLWSLKFIHVPGLKKHQPFELYSYSSNIFYVSETVLPNQWSQSYFIEQKPLVQSKNFNKFLLLTTNVSETTFLLQHI